jgi:hypothetical protein
MTQEERTAAQDYTTNFYFGVDHETFLDLVQRGMIDPEDYRAKRVATKIPEERRHERYH